MDNTSQDHDINSGSTSILVVDDDFGMRLLVSAALQKGGFSVLEAGNGKEALAVYELEKPSAVMMDVMMPEMDGYTACEEFRKIPGTESLPILMMTALDDEESINAAYHAGATDFITKPINYTLLSHRIRYMLRASETTRKLLTSEHNLAKAQRIAQLGHWEWEKEQNYFSWSSEAMNLVGLNDTCMTRIGSFEEFIQWVPDREKGIVADWYRLAKLGTAGESINHTIQRSDGAIRYVRQQIEIVKEEDGGIGRIYGTIQDITEIRKAEEKIQHLAYFDSLTNLPNREFFKKRVQESLSLAKRHNKKGAMLFLDLDNFKRINDTLGHNIGDMLLKAAANRLRESIRTSDVVSRSNSSEERDHLARMGGDEFTLLISEIQHNEDAACTANRILEKFATPFHLAGHEVVVSPSIGITVFPHDGEDVGQLLKNGDLAMYHAKKSGKNAFFFYNDRMNEVAMKRLVMENHLRKALSERELVVNYQPQKDMVTGQTSGVEALLRWHSKELGIVPPSQFIPLAEETGVIMAIGEWVMREACLQAKDWRDNGIALQRMAVNVSVHQFVQPGFVSSVAHILEETKLEPNVLELEVTEGLLMKDANSAVKTLNELKSLRVQLAIDDFGTGYSSLSYLKQFPIDRLKIDRKFVSDVNTDPNDAAITMAVLALAEKMSLKVTAEGVETEEQLGFLQSKNCSEIQGYYFGRPMTAESMEDFLSQPQFRIQSPSSKQPTILIVDDDEASLELNSFALRRDGYSVITATSGIEGLSILSKNNIKVVISDYQMWEMDGNEFLTRVKELYPSIVRIMLSGESDKKSLVDSVNQSSIYRFLEKPVDLGILRETVRTAFSTTVSFQDIESENNIAV